jgi:hypothetical protein
VKSGIASVAEMPLPNPIALQPFRTFIEIEQPESIFVVRAHKGPEFSLFLADGGLWKLKAIQSIKEYFRNNNVSLPVVG